MIHLRAPYDPPIVANEKTRSTRVGGARVGGIVGDLSEATSVREVDAVFRRYLRDGEVPDYIARDHWLWRTIKGGGHVLEVLVPPDYAAVGSDEVPMRLGKTSQSFAQEFADAYGAILPSQKLLRDIECSADVMIPYIPVQKGGVADDSVAAVIKANALADAAIAKKGASNTDGLLKISGYRKAFVVRPNLDGQYIAIHGGRWTVPCGATVQPTSGHAHTEPSDSNGWTYSDASHGVVLVSRKARLDGEDVDLIDDVFLSHDPGVYQLVSDEGRFNPVFPNVGTGETEPFGKPPGGGPSYTVSADVASVQRGLVDLGYDVGSAGADGKLGPDTRAAISAFRGDHSLPGDGIDDELVDAINAALLARFPTAGASRGYATVGAILVGLVAAVAAVYYLA